MSSQHTTSKEYSSSQGLLVEQRHMLIPFLSLSILKHTSHTATVVQRIHKTLAVQLSQSFCYSIKPPTPHKLWVLLTQKHLAHSIDSNHLMDITAALRRHVTGVGGKANRALKCTEPM